MAEHLLRDLMANLLRVAAGAGEPHRIETQVIDRAQAFQAAREVDRSGFGLTDSQPRCA